MSARTSSKPNLPPSEAERDAAMQTYIEAHLAVERITNDYKTQVEALKVAAEKELAEPQAKLAASLAVLERFATGHPELFLKRRKIEVYGGHKIGFQAGRLTVVSPNVKDEKAVSEFAFKCAYHRGSDAEQFYRTVYEVDVQALIKYHNTTATLNAEAEAKVRAEREELLQELGVKIARTPERVVVDLNLQPEDKAKP